MSLVTANYVRTFLRGLNSGDDAELTQLLSWSDSVLASHLHLPVPDGANEPTLASATYIDFLDGPRRGNADTLQLTARPITAITEIADDADWSYDANVVDGSEFVFESRRGRVHLKPTASHIWSRSHRAIRVTYTAGWTSSTLPADVKNAVMLFVREHWRAKTLRGLPNAADEDTFELAELVPPPVAAALSRYVIWEDAVA